MRVTPYLINSLDCDSTVTYVKDETNHNNSNNNKNFLSRKSSIAPPPPNMPELENQAQLNEELGTDRHWQYEVKQPHISMEIEMKSKKDLFKDYIPAELYCTYIYKLCIHVRGLESTPSSQHRSLLAFVQILNGNTLETVEKRGEQIIEGECSTSVTESNFIMLRIKFTETSYHLGRMKFFLRVTLLQKTQLQDPHSTTVPASPSSTSSIPVVSTSTSTATGSPLHSDKSKNFIYRHDSWDPSLELLGSVRSPLFYVYSKKNHTKKAQKRARELNKRRRAMEEQMVTRSKRSVTSLSEGSMSDESSNSANGDDNPNQSSPLQHEHQQHQQHQQTRPATHGVSAPANSLFPPQYATAYSRPYYSHPYAQSFNSNHQYQQQQQQQQHQQLHQHQPQPAPPHMMGYHSTTTGGYTHQQQQQQRLFMPQSIAQYQTSPQSYQRIPHVHYTPQDGNSNNSSSSISHLPHPYPHPHFHLQQHPINSFTPTQRHSHVPMASGGTFMSSNVVPITNTATAAAAVTHTTTAIPVPLSTNLNPTRTNSSSSLTSEK